ncbi:MAG: hypothetical protein H7Y60_13845 [Rhodospirillaceae bacterium]|nr:hypothetical protein [Rhodospirillales bacterium]
MSVLPAPLADRLPWLRNDFAVAAHGSIDVIELDANAPGSVSFTVNSPALQICAHNPAVFRVMWFQEEKSADGMFITFDADGAHLHVVELKMTMTESKWVRVKRQFDGSRLHAFAFQGISGIQDFVSITVYAAFLKNKMRSPILNKPGAVGGAALDRAIDWMEERVTLITGETARLVKIACTDGGAAGFVGTHAVV